MLASGSSGPMGSAETTRMATHSASSRGSRQWSRCGRPSPGSQRRRTHSAARIPAVKASTGSR